MNMHDMGGMDMSMSMCFGCGNYNSYSNDSPIYVVFHFWAVKTKTAYVLSCFAIVFLAFFWRFLSKIEADYSSHLLKELQKAQNHLIQLSSPKATDTMLGNENLKQISKLHSVPLGGYLLLLTTTDSFLKGLLYGLALFLMLVAMTYNYGLVGSLIAGYFLGELFFGVNPIAYRDGRFQILFSTNYQNIPEIDCCN